MKVADETLCAGGTDEGKNEIKERSQLEGTLRTVVLVKIDGCEQCRHLSKNVRRLNWIYFITFRLIFLFFLFFFTASNHTTFLCVSVRRESD